MGGGGGEFLLRRDFGIGIGFQEIGHALRGQAEVDAVIAVEFQGGADALHDALDAALQFRRRGLRPGPSRMPRFS